MDLDLWAQRLDARSQLPHVLRRLVFATAIDLQHVDFPADEGVQLSGWDGIVHTGASSPFVPAGTSVWELGVNKAIKTKADDDYKKRTEEPLSISPNDTVYTFVTLRRWDRKQTWVQARNAEGTWREVRALDAENLAQWLEQAPAVHLWLSELLGKHPSGARSLDRFWTDWADATNPALHPALVIGGRTEPRDRILNWVRGTPDVLTVQGDSSEEAAAFLAAVIQDLPSEERSRMFARAVVVDDPASWRSLVTSSMPLILVPRFSNPEGVGHAVQQGHHVFMPLDRTAATGMVRLPRLQRDAAEQALHAMGMSAERARDLATLARRSLPALRRTLARAPGMLMLAWAQPDAGRALVAPLLVGAWDDTSHGDRAALSQLAGIPYEEVQRLLVRWTHTPDPPVRQVGDVWMVAARENAWELLARYLTMDDLARFERVALDVLSERDPALDLPAEQRSLASLYGKVQTWSGHLRKGIAETLALMASLSSEVALTTNASGEAMAYKIVRTLLQAVTGNIDQWASVAYQLPLLAEAAPGAVLDAIEAGLMGNDPLLLDLFQDQTDQSALSGSSPHIGLLWALETLAWHPRYLGHAALLLARLARLDPGGRLGNRPVRSLCDIFLCWCPHTAAPLNRRLRVLDALRQREPDVAWQLLIQLLPEYPSVATLNHVPRWRDWVPDPRPTVPMQEEIQATAAVLERLLADAQANPSRWCDLITATGDLTLAQREQFLTRLEDLDPSAFGSDTRAQLRDYLRHEIARHREFADAEWAMPSEHVDRLQQVYDTLEPEDLVVRYRWRFRQRVDVPGMHGIEWEQRRDTIETLRVAALQELLAAEGWDGVLRLVGQVEDPSTVGATLTRTGLLPIDVDQLLQDTLAAAPPGRQLVHGVIAVCVGKHGALWISERLATDVAKTWTPQQFGEFLLSLPFNSIVLDHLDAAPEEVRRYFWMRTQHISIPNIRDDVDRVITYLLSFDRAHIALTPIEWVLSNDPQLVAPERIADLLEAAARTFARPDVNPSEFAYASAELLNHLEKTDLPRERLAQLELMYLRLHESRRSPHVLHNALASDPEFFVEVLKLVYPPLDEEPPEASGDVGAWARLGWNLLHLWKRMPGVREDGTVDVEALRAWVMTVRERASACGRRDVADMYIGHAFAFSPADPDGAWPHQGVRDLIQGVASSELENGWWTQTLNNRGVTMRSLTAGGEQERALAQQYASYAEQLADMWPRAAAVLESLADHYRRRGSDEDIRAELTQDFWH